MKVVLVVLSGNPTTAEQTVGELFPQATIETIPRAAIERGGFSARLRALRERKPDVLAVATERLAWQRGQNLFMLFGAMAGAREVVLFDGYGGLRREPRTTVLLKSPRRLAGETVTSANVMARARRNLEKLEREVESQARGQIAAKADNHRPRIVYLRATPGPGTQAGGASSHVKGVVEGLMQLQAQVEILSNDTLAGLDRNKFKMTVIPPEALGSTRAVFDVHNNEVFTSGVVALLQERSPDLIYQRYARFSWAGVVASLRTFKPLFLEYNGSEVWVGKHWDRVDQLELLARYERLNLAAAARIFVVSEVEKKNLLQVGIPAEKIIVNPNGVDTETFRPDVGGEQVRQKLGIRDDEKLVGFVGTFGPWHGVLVLAEAIKSITPNLPVRFLLIGTGALHAETKKLLAAEEQAGRVIFYGGVDHDQVPALLDACDVLVSPHVPLTGGAEFFGSPTKLFEYMAMGKAIVASRLGQIGEVLTDQETALLVEPGNAGQLSEAMTRLIDSPGLRECLGAAARAKAIASHTWVHNAQRVLAAYGAWRNEANN